MILLMRALFSLFLISVSVSVSVSACAQDGGKSGKLVGRWMSVGMDGDVMECPNLLTFSSDGRYSVRNDCYGMNPRNPVTESGKWVFNSGDSQIQFRDRAFVTNYFLWEPVEELRVRVEELFRNTLTLAFGKKAAQFESYKKVEKDRAELEDTHK